MEQGLGGYIKIPNPRQRFTNVANLMHQGFMKFSMCGAPRSG